MQVHGGSSPLLGTTRFLLEERGEIDQHNEEVLKEGVRGTNIFSC